MPRNRKYFVNNMALFVTSRTEEGLPIVSTLVLNFIIWGILARARRLYEVEVCHFVFMFNHFHMLLVVKNPEHVSEYVGYVKGEIAHAINRLRGRRRKTIWAAGYDSPVLLTADTVCKYITYIYRNPAKARMVDSIKEYPGVSSWQMFISGQVSSFHKRLRRIAIPTLGLPALSINEQRRIVDRFRKDDCPGSSEEFALAPFAWMKCFSEYADVSEAEMKERILADVLEAEEAIRIEREEKNQSVIGATALRRQSMDKEHTPKTFGRKMICLCEDIELRKAFIDHYKHLCGRARAIYEAWTRGELYRRIPPGFFAPRVPSLVSAVPYPH